MKPLPYKRIVIIGTTSSGKSTLAKTLSDTFSYDFVELDALHWEANWKEAELSVFRERVEKATNEQAWVVAGNYSKVREIIWSKAEAAIWLDYPFPIVFWRLLTRTIRRGWTREELWNGNREKFWWHLKLWSDESLFKWLFKTYWRRKREIPALLSQPENKHLKLIQFKHPREAQAWLLDLSAEPAQQEG
ncbi:hypothetical protein MASR2M66_06140 [Chloroflexota bacterium]